MYATAIGQSLKTALQLTISSTAVSLKRHLLIPPNTKKINP